MIESTEMQILLRFSLREDCLNVIVIYCNFICFVLQVCVWKGLGDLPRNW